jgi:hypothetical protein
MEAICKATIILGDSKITFEGHSEFVQEQVARFANAETSREPAGAAAASRDRSKDASAEKRLIAEKRPKGHHEIATVLAFALTESGMEEFSEADVRRAYLRGEVRPPKFVSQALRDAKNKFDYIAPGKKRGKYRLTNHGDRTVRFDLPRSEG